MSNYVDVNTYVESASSIKDKLDKLDLIIMALLDITIKSAANQDVEEYFFDTGGETKIRYVYRDIQSLNKSLIQFQRIRQELKNINDGSDISRLVPIENF